MQGPDIVARVEEKSRLKLHQQLSLLTLPPAKRRRLMNGIAKTVRQEARGNIRGQRTIQGRAMEPRKNKRTRRKLLMSLSKGMTTKHRGDLHAEVTWKNAGIAKVADRHQRGIAETWTAAKARKVHGVPDYEAQATAAQAKALIAEGFRLRARKKRGKGVALKRVSQKWIREHLKLGQAGLILRLMRYGAAEGRQRWQVKPAARPFLGATAETADAVLTRLARQALRDMNT